MKNTPTIICPQCGGHGKVELSDILAKTLAGVRQLGKATAPLLNKLPDIAADCISTNAINNRLEQLREMGFLDRTGRAGVGYEYFEKKATKSA